MDVDMLSAQTKENSSPVHYPNLPSPPTNTPPHPHTSSPTWHTPSNVSRKRTPRFAGLADTPARSSYAQQMLKHWSTSTPGSHRSKSKIFHSPDADSEHCSSPKNSCISSPGSNEDPLNDLERAVAMEIPASPKSKQRRKTLFIPGPHCRRYDSDDTSEAWTGDEIFLGKREGPRVSKVSRSPGRCRKKGLGSPLKNCVFSFPAQEVRPDVETASADGGVSMPTNIKAEPDVEKVEAFVTAPQDITSGIDDREDSGKCSSARESSVEDQAKESKGSRFLDMRPGALYPNLAESANSTDLDCSPALTTTSNTMRLSQDNLQKWNKTQMARPRMSRFYHPAAVTRGTCHPKPHAQLHSKVAIKPQEAPFRLVDPKPHTSVLYSTCHLKTKIQAEAVVEPEHTSSDADDEDDSQSGDAIDSPV